VGAGQPDRGLTVFVGIPIGAALVFAAFLVRMALVQRFRRTRRGP
jgi:hypothetical protein